ncbi:MAG: class I SAM-dependent methyltransferase [Thermoanaerobaculia bacterium]|nr:class I SAM-dependent methyltransferase [Thermoanaerobaculia bacterium]
MKEISSLHPPSGEPSPDISSRSAAAALNEEVYDRLPRGYRDYWRFMAAPRFRMETILHLLGGSEPRCVVDLGCGTGLLLTKVAERLPHALRVGIDIAPRQLDIARAADPSASWHVVDLDTDAPVIPSELEGAANAIIAAELVEHLDHPKRLLTSARRLASTGCRLILSTQSGPVRHTELRVGHRRHFSTDEMSELLREAGWNPVRVWNAGWPFHDLSKWWANRNPEGSMQRFGEQGYGWSERAVCWTLRQLFRFNSNRRGAQLFAVAEAP